MLRPSQAGELFLCPFQIQRPIFLFVIMEGCKTNKQKIRQASWHLKAKSWKQNTPSYLDLRPLPTHVHQLLQNSRKRTVQNDWCLKDSHAKGWVPSWSVWHRFPSRWTLAFDLFVVALFVCVFGSVKDQFCGTGWPQTGGQHAPVAF